MQPRRKPSCTPADVVLCCLILLCLTIGGLVFLLVHRNP